MEPLIISVAVTGGEHGREATPHLPITPEEIARSAHEAYAAAARNVMEILFRCVNLKRD